MRRYTDDEHRAAAARQAEELLAGVDFSAPRGGIAFEPSEEVLATYTLQVIGLLNANGSRPFIRLTNTYLRETEENLTDLLPPGYRVEIKEWSDE